MTKIPIRIRQWLTPVVLGLLCWNATPLICQATEVRYNVIKIIEGTGTTAPEAGGINQKGQVVGSMDTFGGSKFWLWSDGVRQDLSPGTNRNCYAKGLNNQGQVVGAFHTGEYGIDFWGIVYPINHAFVWTAGSLQDLGTLGGETSIAVWNNDQGLALGGADTADNNLLPVIVQNGQMRSLQSLMLNPSGWKLALETHYVAADGRIWGLGTYGGKEHIYEMTPETNGMYRIRSRGILEGRVIRVYDLNEFGQAAGLTELPDLGGFQAFTWDEKGMIPLGFLNKPSSHANGLNNLGQVVGAYDSTSWKAFLWENAVMFNLNELISGDSGVVLTEAQAINDAGQIVCTYRNIASGFYGVCLLLPSNPVPLEITDHKLTPDGLRLEVRGGAGQPLAIEYTNDLEKWTTMATSTNLIGRRTFIDPDAGNAAFRAYRARLLTP